jgi:hypothetical protein
MTKGNRTLVATDKFQQEHLIYYKNIITILSISFHRFSKTHISTLCMRFVTATFVSRSSQETDSRIGDGARQGIVFGCEILVKEFTGGEGIISKTML